MSHDSRPEPPCPAPQCAHIHSPGGWYLCKACGNWHQAPCTDQKADDVEKTMRRGGVVGGVSPIQESILLDALICKSCGCLYGRNPGDSRICPVCHDINPACTSVGPLMATYK